jgi:hypothetical protein
MRHIYAAVIGHKPSSERATRHKEPRMVARTSAAELTSRGAIIAGKFSSTSGR